VGHDRAVATVLDAFGRFRGNLELTGLQESAVSDRQRDIRGVMAGALPVVDAFLTGSYRRQTLVAPLSTADVDVVVVLDGSLRRRGPRGVLDVAKGALSESYRTSKVSRNGQAITITFSDFVVDVVPAFAVPWWDFEGGGWDICDSGGDAWLRTNPKRHTERSAEVNSRTGGLLVPTVKMLKAWNRTVKEPVRSFHLEVLAWSIFDPGWLPYHWFGPGATMETDPDNVLRFFSQAGRLLRRRLPDPARNRGDVGAYLSRPSRAEAISKVNTARERCERAETLRVSGDDRAAKAIYQQVFGDAFPV
jgi:SMODS domain-containing protein